MTREDAMLAGQLAEAAENIAAQREELIKDHAENDLIGLGISWDHSGAGSTCSGSEALMPRWAAEKALARVAAYLDEELKALGVEP